MSDGPEFVRYRIEAATVDGRPMPEGDAEFRIIGQLVAQPATLANGKPDVYNFRIADWAGPRPPEGFAPPLADAGGLQWADAAQTAWFAWERLSEARDPLSAASAMVDLANAMSDLASRGRTAAAGMLPRRGDRRDERTPAWTTER